MANPAPPGGLIVLFDGGCPVCRRTVRTLRRLDRRHRLQFADANDDEMRRRVAPDLSREDALRQMHVLDERGRLTGGYDAQVCIARKLTALWPAGVLGALPGVRQAGRLVYRAVAARRVRRGECSDDLCSPAFRRPATGQVSADSPAYRVVTTTAVQD